MQTCLSWNDFSLVRHCRKSKLRLITCMSSSIFLTTVEYPLAKLVSSSKSSYSPKDTELCWKRLSQPVSHSSLKRWSPCLKGSWTIYRPGSSSISTIIRVLTTWSTSGTAATSTWWSLGFLRASPLWATFWTHLWRTFPRTDPCHWHHCNGHGCNPVCKLRIENLLLLSYIFGL